jgi:hypothetical protein
MHPKVYTPNELFFTLVTCFRRPELVHLIVWPMEM